MKMTPDQYFRTLFNVEMSEVKADMLVLLKVTNPQALLAWSELNLTKRPNVVENIYLYGFIKKNLRSSGLFKSNYDPNLINLTLMAFQGSYESMLRKTCIVLFEATKSKFSNSNWYNNAFKDKESNYNTAKVITFIKDCLTEENQTTGLFSGIKSVVNQLDLSRLNKIRNAIAHNIYVVEGDTEENSRICYSETDKRCYFTKEDYQTIKTSELLKLLDMIELFRDLFLESLEEASLNLPNLTMVFCQCGMQAFANPTDIPTKKCYFCYEFGKFKPGAVSLKKYFPPLP